MRRVALAAIACSALVGCHLSHELSGSDAGLRPRDGGVDARIVDAGACAAGAPCDCRAVRVLPAGTHWVGVASERTSSNPFISPVHRVTLTRDTWVGTYEASAGCYARCMDEGACSAPELLATDVPRWGFGERYWESERWADRPIGGLTWEQARAYCAWLGGRLPTNAEWEKLARGSDGRGLPWEPPPADPGWPPRPSGVSLCEHAHRPGFACTGELVPLSLAPIDSHPQGVGPYGHFHVIGNAPEWVADSVARYSAEDAVDPLDEIPGAGRIIRGVFDGGWIRDELERFAWDREPLGVRCAFDTEPMPLPR